MIDNVTDICVVCTGNICRSPMAEYILRKILAETSNARFRISSAGTHALVGNAAEPGAVYAVSSLYDIDLKPHRARQLDKTMIDQADFILAMENNHLAWIVREQPGAESKTFLLGRYREEGPVSDVFDPYGQTHDRYLKCADLIHSCIQGWIKEMGLSKKEK